MTDKTMDIVHTNRERIEKVRALITAIDRGHEIMKEETIDPFLMNQIENMEGMVEEVEQALNGIEHSLSTARMLDRK